MYQTPSGIQSDCRTGNLGDVEHSQKKVFSAVWVGIDVSGGQFIVGAPHALGQFAEVGDRAALHIRAKMVEDFGAVGHGRCYHMGANIRIRPW